MREVITLKKGSDVKDFITEDGKVLKTINIGGREVSNPTLQMMYDDGWEDWVRPAPKPYIPTREENINREIRERYSSDDEAQIVREMIAGKEGAKERFDEYNSYVESILAKYPEV